MLPPASPRPEGKQAPAHRALRPVQRFDQRDGGAPCNGDAPVTTNSAAVDADLPAEPAVAMATRAEGWRHANPFLTTLPARWR